MAKPFGSEDYLEAALLRMEEAHCLYGSQHWLGVVYLSGRAVESLLRSLLWLQNRQQEVGHDLRDILKRVRTLGLARSDRKSLDRIEDAVNELAVIWYNNLRFAGLRRFSRDLRSNGRADSIRGVKVKGDAVKANAKSALEACEIVISFGEPLCRRLRKS